MSLKDVFTQLNSHEDDGRRRAVQIRLDLLKARVAANQRSVLDQELAQGIRDQFDVDSTSDFLRNANWLMEALSFTDKPISSEDATSAWAIFQSHHNFVFDYFDYPILEALSYWYFEHKDDRDRDELAMVARSVAVLEYLFTRIRNLSTRMRHPSREFTVPLRCAHPLSSGVLLSFPRSRSSILGEL
jgi:hypothetical protein